MKLRFNWGRQDSKGNFNFQKVCIRKISKDGYDWQIIHETLNLASIIKWLLFNWLVIITRKKKKNYFFGFIYFNLGKNLVITVA